MIRVRTDCNNYAEHFCWRCSTRWYFYKPFCFLFNHRETLAVGACDGNGTVPDYVKAHPECHRCGEARRYDKDKPLSSSLSDLIMMKLYKIGVPK